MTKQEKLAVILYEFCEFRFSRKWDDVPQDVKELWREISGDVIKAMKDEHWKPE